MKSGIKFPSYKTPEEAMSREQTIHKMMEKDIADFQKTKR
jgi:hypothetical protein